MTGWVHSTRLAPTLAWARQKGGGATVETHCTMKSGAFRLAICTLVLLSWATSARGEKTSLHPPAAVIASLAQLREIDSLAGLPAPIRGGVFALPGGTQSRGWELAAPGASWNATDAIVDPSLPGRRMIVALCSATICVLHYERGGIAHVYLVMSLVRKGDAWTATWLAYGHPGATNVEALKSLLQNRSSLDYHDDTNARIDY